MARPTTSTILGLAGLLGLSAVAAGAFGAHGETDPGAKALLQTGGEYGMVHALAAIAAGGLASRGARRALAAAWCFLGGAAIFSGSLYLIALTGTRLFGAVTPIGGLLLLTGWGLFAWAGFTLKS